MKFIRFGFSAALVLAALLFAFMATEAAAQQRTVVGILESTASAGHDTPGWQVRLEEPIVLGKVAYDTMDVYLEEGDLSTLAGKRVAATGTFVQWRTPERGKFIVLEICEIVPAGQQ